MGAAAEPPVLYHLKVSHFNEKARWALDYKQVSHARKALLPGTQQRVARKLTGGTTVPILVLDGRAIGDTTEIIAALEERHPQPPLYPADPDLRRQALELEDYFDEQLGAHIRLLIVHHMLPDADLFLAGFMPDLNRPQRIAARVGYPVLRRQVISTFGIDAQSIARAWEQVRSVGERFEQTVRPSGYLVGDEFTVADLTLAALSSPAAAPEQFPYPQPQRTSQLVEPLRQAFAESGLLDWTRETYARHRPGTAEVAAGQGLGAC